MSKKETLFGVFCIILGVVLITLAFLLASQKELRTGYVDISDREARLEFLDTALGSGLDSLDYTIVQEDSPRLAELKVILPKGSEFPYGTANDNLWVVLRAWPVTLLLFALGLMFVIITLIMWLLATFTPRFWKGRVRFYVIDPPFGPTAEVEALVAKIKSLEVKQKNG